MAWYDSDYGFKKKITIDHTKVAGDETDFPVLISVTDNDLRDEGNGGHVKNASGYDIVFTNGDEDTLLKHEIERYVNTDGLLVFWVKINSLSSTVDTDFYIYYGKADVVADPSTTDTWDSNFIAVYHMDSTNTTLVDSTGNRNATKDANDKPENVVGKIGNAQDFEATDEEKAVATKVGAIENLSLECWYKPESSGADQRLIMNTDIAAASKVSWVFRRDADKKIRFVVYSGAANMATVVSANTVENASNAYIVGVVNDENYVRVFLNGAQNATDDTVTGTITDPASAILILGADQVTAGVFREWADGVMDEVRISDSPRSNNWIATTYETQDDPTNFMSWGAEESPLTHDSSDIVNISDTVAFKRLLNLDDNIGISDSPIYQHELILADTITANDSIVFKHSLALSDAISISDAATFKRLLYLADSMNISDAIIFKHLINLVDTLTTTDSTIFKHMLYLADSVNISDSEIYKYIINILDSVSVSDIAAFKHSLTLGDTVSITESIVYKHLIALADTLNITDIAILKHILSFTDSINISDTATFKRLLNILDNINISDITVFKHFIALNDTIALSDSIIYKHLITLADSIGISEEIILKHFINLLDAITAIDSIVYKHNLYLSDTFTIYDGSYISLFILDNVNILDEININLTESCYTIFTLQGDSYSVLLPRPEYANESGTLNNKLTLFDFWLEERSLVHIEIESEPFTLSGTIFACSSNKEAEMTAIAIKFLNIHEMMDNNEKITITGLNDCVDAVYVIKNFKYGTVRNSPYAYTWSLTLEYVRAL